MNGGTRPEYRTMMDEDNLLEDDIEKHFLQFKDLDGKVTNSLCPTMRIMKGKVRWACQPWKKAIIVKLLGMCIRWKHLRARLTRLWTPV